MKLLSLLPYLTFRKSAPAVAENSQVAKVQQKLATNILILGRRAVGKSSLIKDILCLQYLKPEDILIKKAIIINGTEDIRPYYSIDKDVLRFATVYNSFYEKGVETDLANLDKSGGGTVVFENWEHDRPSSDALEKLLQGNVSVILSCTHYLTITPALRQKFHKVYLFKEPIFTNRTKYYQFWGGAFFPCFEVFEKVYNSVTRKSYSSLVLDNRDKTVSVGTWTGEYGNEIFSESVMELSSDEKKSTQLESSCNSSL